MFVNGDGVGAAVRLLLVVPALLVLTLAAHAAWVVRLARSDTLGRPGPPGRLAVLALAAATPVVGFHCVRAVRLLRGPVAGRGRVAASLPGTAGLLALSLFGVLLLAHVRWPVSGEGWPGVLARLPGMIAVCAFPSAALSMAGQVLAGWDGVRAWRAAIAGSAAICLFVLA